MPTVTTLLQVFVPMFLFIMIGYALSYKDIVPSNSKHILAKFVITVTLPLLLFAKLATSPPLHSINMPVFYSTLLTLLGMYIGTFGCTLLLRQHSKKTAMLTAMLVSMPELAMMGAPLIGIILPGSTFIAIVLANLVVMLLLIPMSNMVLDWHNIARPIPNKFKQAFHLARQSLILYPLAGIIVAECQFHLPPLLVGATLLVGGLTTIISLLCLGIMLHEDKFTLSKSLFMNAALKLLAQPLLALLSVWLLGLSGHLAKQIILLAALPSSALVCVFACYFKHDSNDISSSILITLLLSFVSLSLILQIM